MLPIWEGTTNVLSLDALRALASPGTAEALAAEAGRLLAQIRDPSLRPAGEAAGRALDHARAWLAAAKDGPEEREAGARRFAMTLGRSIELALLCAHAEWSLAAGRGGRAAAAARRLSRNGVDLVDDALDRDDARLLAGEG